MMLQIKTSILLICLTMFFYSCQKEYSLEGNQTAVLTFPGAPGACTNAVVTGIYQSGVALDATNLVTISVEVTKIGSYIISTAISNGISFSGTGTFTTTGTQTITLSGSGIPVSTGTFSFAPGAGGCSFAVTVTGGGNPGTPAVFTLNGAPGNCTGFTTAGTYTAGTALGASNTVGIGVTVTSVGTYTITSNTVNGITFSATGTFTSTGSKVVQLTGSGTPLVAGAFNYLTSTGGCTFSITVTGGGTPAVFTLNGAPGNCTGFTTAGTYTAGTALGAGNTVGVGVTVTTVGTYTITSNTVNGITFSSTGTFTSTGSQVVQLTGSGTPLVAGPFNYLTSTGGCTFTITVVPGAVVNDFLRCTIDGVAKTFNVGAYCARITADTFEIAGAETTAGNSPIFGFLIRKAPSITTGTYNRLQATNTSSYCLAVYDDGVSTSPWVSGLSPTAATFTVNVTLVSATRIDGTFSGTIYSDYVNGTGPTKAITLGQFSLPIQ